MRGQSSTLGTMIHVAHVEGSPSTSPRSRSTSLLSHFGASSFFVLFCRINRISPCSTGFQPWHRTPSGDVGRPDSDQRRTRVSSSVRSHFCAVLRSKRKSPRCTQARRNRASLVLTIAHERAENLLPCDITSLESCPRAHHCDIREDATRSVGLEMEAWVREPASECEPQSGAL